MNTQAILKEIVAIFDNVDERDEWDMSWFRSEVSQILTARDKTVPDDVFAILYNDGRYELRNNAQEGGRKTDREFWIDIQYDYSDGKITLRDVFEKIAKREGKNGKEIALQVVDEYWCENYPNTTFDKTMEKYVKWLKLPTPPKDEE